MKHIVYNHNGGKWGVPLSLIEGQKIEFEELAEIVRLHKERLDLRKFLTTATDTTVIEIASKQLTQMEFDLQMLWGFPTDFNYHKHWEMPGCTCPRMDNREMAPYRVYISGGCLLHAYLLK